MPAIESNIAASGRAAVPTGTPGEVPGGGPGVGGWLKDAIQVKRDRDLAIHQQIAEQIERLIAAGRLSPGQQLPTHKELARLLDVHPVTVGKSYGQLQNQGVISQQRGRGTFVGDAKPTHKSLVVLLPKWEEYSQQISNAYNHQQCLAGMEEACRDIHAHLRILTVPTQLSEADMAYWAAHIRKHHNGVLTTMREHQPLLSYLAAEGFPVLIYHQFAEAPNISNCLFGWYESLKLATEHLIKLGRKRITYLGPIVAKPIPNRSGFDGFLAALEEAELPYYPSLSIRFPQFANSATVAQAIEHAVQAGRLGDAVVCHGMIEYEAGTNCVRVLHRHGRRVPEDVAIVGFEENLTGEPIDPPLTWIPVPRYEIGRQAVRMIHQIMQDPTCAPLRASFVPQLVPGRSCGGFPNGNGKLEQVYITHAQLAELPDMMQCQ